MKTQVKKILWMEEFNFWSLIFFLLAGLTIFLIASETKLVTGIEILDFLIIIAYFVLGSESIFGMLLGESSKF